MIRRHKPRRGVVLLVVLTLLTLLIVVGVTLVVLSGQFRRAAEANARQERYGDDPEKLLDRAMYQLVRDTPEDSRSVLKGHSLLRDLLGNDGVAGTVREDIQPTESEFVNFNVSPPFASFNKQQGYYNGCTLSFLDPVVSPSGNNSMIAKSTRIVGYRPTVDPSSDEITNIEILIEWSVGEGGVAFYPKANTRFLINGRPFNGMGAGYSLDSHSLDQKVPFISSGAETALLPNYSYYADMTSTNPALGGLDESWDAVDFQNMFLAMVPPVINNNGIIPSFHRPALVNYWMKRFAAEELPSLSLPQKLAAFRNPFDTNVPIGEDVRKRLANLKRSIILRPLPEDHPSFPNPENFNATMGVAQDGTAAQELPEMVWDVDNDGDGIPDSIWIDVGLPIQTDDSGRRYKPLVAILCQDLDGRLNVNAHSNVAQMETTFAEDGELQNLPKPSDSPRPFASGIGRKRLSRGLGLGPAEVFLGHVFGWHDFAHVLFQRHNFARHGLRILDQDGTLNQDAHAGIGKPSTDDTLSQIKNVGVPSYYPNQLSAYGSPPNIWGNGGIGLDYTGQPIPIYMGGKEEVKDDPYEIVLNRKSAGYHDAPFTLAELERVLRYDDIDAFGLPKRLVANSVTKNPVDALHGNEPPATENRRLITTDSSYLASIAGAMPKKMRELFDDSTSHSILDLYRERIMSEPEVTSRAQAEEVMERIVPWEIWHGERFNVNRLLGNGRDDDDDGVVDEPAEADVGEIIWPSGLPGRFGDGIRFNYLNDDPVFTDLDDELLPPQPPFTSRNRFAAPQIYARHLYCLMMLLADRAGIEYFHPTSEGLNEEQRRELTAQRIAQWAINVVDFRDSNAIMTPFEYDVNPFNGWQPMDGDPRTNDAPDTGPNERRIVWGAEYPDLLLTESTAFHDRRVKDTDLDSTGEKLTDPDSADQTMDQYRIPQGSLFLEFYCTRNRARNNPILPRELYTSTGKLDLAKLSPRPRIPRERQVPVWRVAISRSHHPSAPGEAVESPQTRYNDESVTAAFKPSAWDQRESMNVLENLQRPRPGPPSDELVAERYVWFTPVAPSDLDIPPAQAKRIYRNRMVTDPEDYIAAKEAVQMKPASYLVVGPRRQTHMGSLKQREPQPGDPPQYLPSPQRIMLLDNRVGFFSSDGTDRTPSLNEVKQAQTMVAATDPPNNWTDSLNTALLGTGLTGDPIVGIGLSVTEPLPGADYYTEPTERLHEGDDGFPFIDSYYNYDTQTGVLPDEPFDSQEGRPLKDDNILQTGTTADYKTAFLQRLANPLEPWDPLGNPYITVDWIPIDVTVFNGEDPAGNPDPDDPNDNPTPEFESRERAGEGLNLWSAATQDPRPSPRVGSTAYFDFDLLQSLGYLNEPFGSAGINHPTGATLLRGDVGDDYVGDPKAGPFPWLAWFNRPFANPMELMQVPSSTPSRLSHEFDISPTTDPYQADDLESFRGTFPHLLNFFHSSTTDDESRRGANFYRLFDYVETPSPFVGAEKWYNPAKMTDGNQFHFHPPYNRLSRFQDPGRVNINTIFDSRVWEGIAKGFPAMDPTVSGGEEIRHRIFESRRGYEMPPGKFFRLNSDYPTLFANPFRAADSADLMPDVPPGDNSMRKAKPVQATLLREDVLNAPGQPLFVPDSDAVPFVKDPHQNQDRNSYFRYHGMARLSNLVSNNSNVFAVWITLGYFEVEPNVPENAPDGTPPVVDQAHPDGFRLGAELGTYSGDIKRHRAFYIIDRSTPVAFEPGQNNNVDHAILLRRFIE